MRMKTLTARAVYLAAATAGLAIAPASAQQDETATEAAIAEPAETEAAPVVAAAEAPKPECELHVFPTVEGQAITTGWLSGFGIIGAVADAAANKNKNVSETEYLKEALGPNMQKRSLESIDLVSLLHLPPSQIIYETPIADRKVSTAATSRLSNSTAPCYAELIVTQNLYQKRAIYGRSLNNRFIFKDFRGGKEKASLFKGRGGNGLTHFPPQTTDETEAAEADLQQAFVKNLQEFAATVKS